MFEVNVCLRGQNKMKLISTKQIGVVHGQMSASKFFENLRKTAANEERRV